MNSFVDKDPNFRIHYDVTGPRRKELVKALGEILLWEPKYLGAPDFWYQAAFFPIDQLLIFRIFLPDYGFQFDQGT